MKSSCLKYLLCKSEKPREYASELLPCWTTFMEHLSSLTHLQEKGHSEDADACILPGCTCIRANQASVVWENSVRQKSRDTATHINRAILA